MEGKIKPNLGQRPILHHVAASPGMAGWRHEIERRVAEFGAINGRIAQ
jgi:hypothetical protein